MQLLSIPSPVPLYTEFIGSKSSRDGGVPPSEPFVNNSVSMLGESDIVQFLFFRSDLTCTLPPQSPSRDPKAPALQRQTPTLPSIACFIHILSSPLLLLFRFVFTLSERVLRVCVESTSDGSDSRVQRASVSADAAADGPEECWETDREGRRQSRKVTLGAA